MREDEHRQMELEYLQQLEESRALDEALAQATKEDNEITQQLEEAVDRANYGLATEDDWNIIRRECGATQRPVLLTLTRK